MKIKFNLPNLLIFGSILISSGLQAQEVFGKWKVVNDAGRVNSIVEIYEKDNAVHGKVIRITKEEHRDRKCTECPGNVKNQPIEGLNVIRDFKKEGAEYVYNNPKDAALFGADLVAGAMTIAPEPITTSSSIVGCLFIFL